MSQVVRLISGEPTMRQKVIAMEDFVRTLDPVQLTYRHYFSVANGRGLYAREMFIPKGTIVTGKIHKWENMNIMSAGELSVLTESGVVRVRAPFTIVSPAGTKRIAYAHEDTVWTTIHPTNERDLEKIEAEFTADTDEQYLAFCALQIEERELWRGVQ